MLRKGLNLLNCEEMRWHLRCSLSWKYVLLEESMYGKEFNAVMCLIHAVLLTFSTQLLQMLIYNEQALIRFLSVKYDERRGVDDHI